jgi:methyl-accepting chemotaxis protein
MYTKVKIGGVIYTIELVDDGDMVNHNNKKEKRQALAGEFDYLKQYIKVLKSSPERELREILYAIIHIIIIEYTIRELIDDTNEGFRDIAMDQLTLGLAEALGSIGITKLDSTNINTLMNSTKIKIGCTTYNITKVNDKNEVSHNDIEDISDLSGEISYSKQSIRILKTSPERELRAILHEILHGIIMEYSIRELIDDNDDHNELAIHQLSLGLAEVLESVENVSIASNID